MPHLELDFKRTTVCFDLQNARDIAKLSLISHWLIFYRCPAEAAAAEAAEMSGLTKMLCECVYSAASRSTNMYRRRFWPKSCECFNSAIPVLDVDIEHLTFRCSRMVFHTFRWQNDTYIELIETSNHFVLRSISIAAMYTLISASVFNNNKKQISHSRCVPGIS